ncbi:MAG TPA: extracellular solute-binding protein [Actinocrinis sp.]|jgi:ABC-type glycerol-3-phosphate transport system substrate-binding protein
MNRTVHRRPAYRNAAAVAVAAALGFSAAACSSSGQSASTSKVTISVDCAAPASKPVAYKEWNEDVAAFEKANPNITINSIRTFPCETPALFTAALKAGTEANVFYTYYTDQGQVLDDGQAADISQYVTTSTVPNLNYIVPTAMNAVKAGGSLYGLPTSIYTMGLVYNRNLFQQAGLNPDDPPTTWAEVEADAKKIAALGTGIAGYGDYSAGHNGGWHFVSEMDALGTHVLNADNTTANFNNNNAVQLLQILHQMRYVDNDMGQTQDLAWGTLQAQMAAGKLGMYIAAPDDITYMVQSLGANYNDYGMGQIPSISGKPAGSLLGGNDVMFAKKDTPAQIEAGIKWVNFEYLTEGDGQFNYQRLKADKQAVGLPEPELFKAGSPALADDIKLKTQYATIPVQYYTKYINAAVPGIPESILAQPIYAALDNVMSGVLTDPNANYQQLLSSAATQVNTLISNSQ